MSTITSAQAYQGIRPMWMRRELRSGERVSLIQLAQHLGCRAVPVVEAMRELETKGDEK